MLVLRPSSVEKLEKEEIYTEPRPWTVEVNDAVDT
jgi:hypothetical protein